ncbi:hypothetical protein [Thermotalea metallivorans]|uniref:Ferrochelatase n=1 Tax=Thermotalea metallivorans TaxID=520762 RepID=A0A140L5U3_9FIRM|nr:hypothetical protein [Thermotalea metallivorans]KXG75918.1 hypothetical protein AN619_13810 [Thermotalea metallivorans]
MKGFVAVKEMLLAILFGMALMGYLVLYGKTERLSIVLLSVLILQFMRSWRKIHWLYCSRIFMGMVVGIFLGYYGLFTMIEEGSFEDQLPGFRNRENTGVLLIFEGEPEKYNLPMLVNSLKKERKGIEKVYIPIKLYQYKRAYEKQGISRYNEKASQIRDKLRDLLAPHYDVFISYISCMPYHYEVMEQMILKENYGKVIIVPVSLSKTVEQIGGAEGNLVKHLFTSKAILRYSEPLWNSEKIAKSVVKRIGDLNENADINHAGIILMGKESAHGNQQIMEPNHIKQELLFMEKIKKMLVNQGFDQRKIIGLEIYEDKKAIKNAVHGLQQYGVGKIYMVAIGVFWDKIENQSRMDRIIKEIKREENVKICYIEGWGVEDLLIEELENRIRLLNVQE